jgi:hypothetical protein
MHTSRPTPVDPHAPRGANLVVNEIYASIQGESSYAGLPCVFVRLTACNLRCSWCDSVLVLRGTRRTVDRWWPRSRGSVCRSSR